MSFNVIDTRGNFELTKGEKYTLDAKLKNIWR